MTDETKALTTLYNALVAKTKRHEAEASKRYRAKKSGNGMKLIRVWIPLDKVHEFSSFVESISV